MIVTISAADVGESRVIFLEYTQKSEYNRCDHLEPKEGNLKMYQFRTAHLLARPCAGQEASYGHTLGGTPS